MAEQSEKELRVLSLDAIIVPDLLRPVNEEHVQRIIDSFHVNGGRMINPITVDANLVLEDGGHRLEAAKREGWQAVPVIVDHTVTSKAVRDLNGLIANNVRYAMNPLDAARVYKQTIEPRLKEDRAQARRDGYQARGGEGPRAVTAQGPDASSIGLPIAENGKMRSSVPLVTGFAESKINEAYQLQCWAEDVSAAPELRDAAAKAVAHVRKTPGALHVMFKKVDSLQRIVALPPEQRPAPPSVAERAEQLLDEQLTKTVIRLGKSVEAAEDLFKKGHFDLWQGQTHHAAEFYALARVLTTIARSLDPKHTVGVNPDDDHS